MSDVLARIVERTRARLAGEPSDDGDLRRAARDAARSRKEHAFSTALQSEGVNIIAEIKSASPSAGPIIENPDVERIAADYREGGAAAISVVTEPEFFRGSRHWLRRASGAAGLPVIMKDFVVEPSQILAGVAAGADAMLLIASLLDADTLRRFIGILAEHGCDALVEVHDEADLERALAGGARLIGVNNRDLRTFRVDLGTSERLGALIPEDVIKVAESGISSANDVQRMRAARFDAFLVGESLLRQNDRAAAVRRLRGAPPTGRPE
ncbi:MAG TPA: indole-3-glycerol phosphate synthase TrpC [Thermoanaerobaculia bacterium]|nr:indole-3-glycerol phosphate synthase TrpC [Thermoanaerobaculia bacterium]